MVDEEGWQPFKEKKEVNGRCRQCRQTHLRLKHWDESKPKRKYQAASWQLCVCVSRLLIVHSSAAGWFNIFALSAFNCITSIWVTGTSLFLCLIFKPPKWPCCDVWNLVASPIYCVSGWFLQKCSLETWPILNKILSWYIKLVVQ